MRASPDLPVRVALSGQLAQEVTAFVESEAGWHVVDGDGPLAPVVTLAAQPQPHGANVVVARGPVAAEDVRAALLGGAMDVIVWPQERARLMTLVERLDSATAPAAAAPVLRVGACRGGVGASTVALAVGGLVAWSGRAALVVGGDALVRLAGLSPWEGAGAAELAVLGAQSGEEVTRVARGVPGVAGLSVLGGGATIGSCAGWPFDLIVVDGGTASARDAHLVVGAADGSLDEAPAGADVLVMLHGPLDRAGVRRRLGRQPLGWLPYSARVARAGVAGRVPSSLPGSWVGALRAALALTLPPAPVHSGGEVSGRRPHRPP